MDQPCKVANPACGQLSRDNQFLPIPVRAGEFGLARRVRPAPPSSARSFSALQQNLVLTHGIPPAFRDGVQLYRQPRSGQSRGYQVTQLCTNGVHCRDSASRGTVVLKVVPVPGAAFSDITIWTNTCAPLFFPRPLLIVVEYPPVLSTCPLRTNSGCGKERRILFGSW